MGLILMIALENNMIHCNIDHISEVPVVAQTLIQHDSPVWLKMIALTSYMMANMQFQSVKESGRTYLRISSENKLKNKANYCQIFFLWYIQR